MERFNIGKPRVCVVGPYYTLWPHALEISVVRGFVQSGYDVSIVDVDRDVNYKDFLLVQRFDLVIFMGRTKCPKHIIEGLKSKKVLIFNEQIRLPQYRSWMQTVGSCFDYIFHFDQSALDVYGEIGLSAQFLPIAADQTKFPRHDVQQDIDVLMLGNMSGFHRKRAEVLQHLRGQGINATGVVNYDVDASSRLYSRAKVVLNLGLNSGVESDYNDFCAFGLQQRIFEAATATNGVILTHGVQQKLFRNHEHLIYFKCKSDLTSKVKGLLQNPQRIKQINEAMTKEINEKHLYRHRVLQLIGKV